MTFVAHAGGEKSKQFSVEVWILPTHYAPVCKDLAVTVQAGASVALAPECVDPDQDSFAMSDVGAPAHGTYDPATKRYTAAPRFAGQDSMTFTVVDEWGLKSAVRKIAITVTSGSLPTATNDKAAPKLKLRARVALRARASVRRGIRFTATSSEPGRLVVEALIDGKLARRLGIARRIGSLARNLPAGDTTVKLKLYREARRHLAGLKRVKVKLIARIADAAGNVQTQRMRVTLKNNT